MTEKLYLALDDTRDMLEIAARVELPEDPDKFHLVKNYEGFVDFIKTKGVPDFVTFDFDLSLDSMREYIRALDAHRVYDRSKVKSKTGLDCVEFLINHCRENKIKFPEYKIHSANHFGAEWIYKAIKYYLNYEKNYGLL